MLVRHRALLDRIEARYGVDRHILVAIWGMESSYGEVLSDPKIVKSVVRSLATLAYADRAARQFGRQQLIAALKILQRGDISVAGLTGSWAGAMGHTQFIPTTYEAYAVDFDGDGRRDIWNSPADALASAANYLRKSGWVAGKTWGYEVVLPQDFDYRLAEDGDRARSASGAASACARARGERLSARRRQRRAGRAGRRERAGVPDASQPFRHQALQQRDRLCAGRRASRRPAARRRSLRAGLAGRATGRSRPANWRNCSNICAGRLL